MDKETFDKASKLLSILIIGFVIGLACGAIPAATQISESEPEVEYKFVTLTEPVYIYENHTFHYENRTVYILDTANTTEFFNESYYPSLDVNILIYDEAAFLTFGNNGSYMVWWWADPSTQPDILFMNTTFNVTDSPGTMLIDMSENSNLDYHGFTIWDTETGVEVNHLFWGE